MNTFMSRLNEKLNDPRSRVLISAPDLGLLLDTSIIDDERKEDIFRSLFAFVEVERHPGK